MNFYTFIWKRIYVKNVSLFTVRYLLCGAGMCVHFIHCSAVRIRYGNQLCILCSTAIWMYNYIFSFGFLSVLSLLFTFVTWPCRGICGENLGMIFRVHTSLNALHMVPVLFNSHSPYFAFIFTYNLLQTVRNKFQFSWPTGCTLYCYKRPLSQKSIDKWERSYSGLLCSE